MSEQSTHTRVRSTSINNWAEVTPMTIAELERKSGSQTRSGRSGLSRTTRAVNEFIVWSKANDKIGQAFPVLNYTRASSAQSIVSRLRRAHVVVQLVREGKPLEGNVPNAIHGMRFIDLREGEKLFAAAVNNPNGSHDVWVALLEGE